ncbi:MAG: RnfABCDGE type electron transport complex subunit D [Bacteroidia bacterium]
MIQKILPNFLSELEDPRYFQVLYLGSFLFYGINYLGWDQNILVYSAYIVAAIVSQLVCEFFTRKRYSSVKSALITALGLSLLLHVSHWWVAVLAAVIAIASKFIIKSKGKHIFNPANIGIVGAIALSNQAWISPGQWGSETIIWFFIGSAGLIMILKVGRLDTAFTFISVFGLLLLIRQVIYLGWDLPVWTHMMSNGTLLLFSFFMITDPRTTPNHRVARIIWACIMAIGLFVLSNYFYIQTAAIWLLFFISPLTPLFDKFFKAKQYQWKPPEQIKTIST